MAYYNRDSGLDCLGRCLFNKSCGGNLSMKTIIKLKTPLKDKFFIENLYYELSKIFMFYIKR